MRQQASGTSRGTKYYKLLTQKKEKSSSPKKLVKKYISDSASKKRSK